MKENLKILGIKFNEMFNTILFVAVLVILLFESCN